MDQLQFRHATGDAAAASIAGADQQIAVSGREATRIAARVWQTRIEHGNALLHDVYPALALQTEAATEADYTRAPFLLAPCKRATSVLITFGGNTGYLLLPPGGVDMSRTHLIAIRDPKRCFALCGLPGLGKTYADCLATLRVLVEALDVEDIYCTGVSSGGYPALRYGLDLGACGVLGFSAPTTLDLADDAGAPLSRYPQLTALYRENPGLKLDLAKLYAATVPRPRAMLLYSPSNERDTWLAHRMGGIEGVEIGAVSEDAGHRVFNWLNSGNNIPEYIARLLALRPVKATAEEDLWDEGDFDDGD